MNFAVHVLISVHQNPLVKVTRCDVGGDSTKKNGTQIFHLEPQSVSRCVLLWDAIQTRLKASSNQNQILYLETKLLSYKIFLVLQLASP